MQTKGNTILITGGTSGIGLELAKQFLELGNTVLITGRKQDRLDEAQKQLPGVHTFRGDVSDAQAIPVLAAAVTVKFPTLNVLVNNAGIMRSLNLHSSAQDPLEVCAELETNLNGPIRMIQALLPHLKKQSTAAIVNVSSGLAFVPFPLSPVYCAAKAGLHSYTQSLRVQLKRTSVKVFELAPPLTETPLVNQFDAKDMEGIKAMPVATLAKAAVDGMAKDRFEIRPGSSNALKLMSRIAPAFILAQMSKSADAMLVREGV